MAHFAYVLDGIVRKVHVVANPVITDENGDEQELLGQEFLAELWGYSPADIVQCSYNGSMRGRYPAAGYSYDETLDVFFPPMPDGDYVWDESEGDWVEVVNEAT